MNHDTTGFAVNKVPALRICAEYAGLLPRRMLNFLLVSRNRERHLSNESAWEGGDEMLVGVPGDAATSFWKTYGPPVERSRKIASSFGDW